jgi:hypothetical protein
MTSVKTSYYSAFCYQDMRVLQREERAPTRAAILTQGLADFAKVNAKLDPEAKLAKAQRVVSDGARRDSFERGNGPVALFIYDVIGCLPVLSQLAGWTSIAKGLKLRSKEDANGRHAMGTGYIVRGVVQILNLGPLVLITDVAVSIFKSFRTPSAESAIRV